MVELGANVVAGASKAGDAPVVDDPNVCADVVAMLKLGLATLSYAGGGAHCAATCSS